MTYDLIILGGGPAGVSAGVYASRKKLKTLVLAKDMGGQSTVSENIQNWIGTPSISGNDLAKSLKNHLLAFAEGVLDLKEGEIIEKITEKNHLFQVKTKKAEYEGKSVLIATGSKRRRLTVEGADKFEHKGVTYCASCDGPLFADMDLAVIGGGNAGFETAAQLLAYAKSVTLFESNSDFKADKITVEKVLANPKMKAVVNAELLKIEGDNFVSGLNYKDKATGEIKNLAVSGIFVEIGAIPSTEFAKEIVNLNNFGQVITDPRNQRTSKEGIWSAGDCTDGLYHQNNIASGDAVKALEDIYIWLQKRS
jgi:alkyl hydroperoxide reductase subunit F